MRTLRGLLLGSLLLTACEPLPGDVVGTFQVTMTLTENSCGAGAVHSLDGKRYAVELREDGKEAFWRIPGQTPLSGKYEKPDFTFEYSSIVASDSNDAGTKACRLVQSEVLKGYVVSNVADAAVAEQDPLADADTQDAGDLDETPAKLEAWHTMTISAQPGSDCASALQPEGAFEKLPCVLRYDLKGTPRKPL